MWADQMIFTACGKEKNGDFDVWSKSVGVTEVDCNKIHDVMDYEKPDDAPTRPTEEQVCDETLYPPKYGYFMLPSGRLCVARSGYIGKTYSIQDNRTGNLIIHAYIFDDKYYPEFLPLSIFGLNVFKTKLTYKEWHDDPIPDSLLQVELKGKCVCDNGVLTKMCGSSSLSNIGSFLQAVSDAAQSDVPVTFNCDASDLKKYYALVGKLLPYSIQRKLYFASQFESNREYKLREADLPPIKVRDLTKKSLESFDFQDQMNMDNIVFDFNKDICSDIKPKRYVQDIIETIKNFGIAQAEQKANYVENVMHATNCSSDEAIGVYYLGRSDFRWFRGREELCNALKLVEGTNLIDKKAVAARLATDVIKTKIWGSGQEIFSLVKFVYENSDVQTRTAIIEDYFVNCESYGVAQKQSPDAFVKALKGNAPFEWKDLCGLIVSDPKWENALESGINPNKAFAILDACVDIVRANANVVVAQRMIYKLYKFAVGKLDLNTVKLYNTKIVALGPFFNRLIETALGASLDNCIKDSRVLEFVLQLILELNDTTQKITLLTRVTRANLNNSEFIPLYVKYSDIDEVSFERVSNALSAEPAFSDFVFRMKAYSFGNKKQISFKDLQGYFDEYYVTGFDNGVYIVKIKEYLKGFSGKTLFAECLRIYAQIESLDVRLFDVLDIVKLLENTIYTISVDDLLLLADGRIDVLFEIRDKLKHANCTTSDRQKLLFALLTFRGRCNGNRIVEIVQSNKLYDQLNAAQLKELIQHYFKDITEFYFKQLDKQSVDKNRLVEAVFGFPMTLPNGIGDLMLKQINSLPGRKSNQIMADLIVCMLGVGDMAVKLKSTLGRKIYGMKRGDVKKMYGSIVKYVSNADLKNVDAYFNDYFNTHKTFLQKLFGKKK